MTSNRRDFLTFLASAPLALGGIALFTQNATAINNPRFHPVPVLEDNFNEKTINTRIWNVRDSGNFMATGVAGPGDKNWPSINKNSTAVDQASNIQMTGSTAKFWVRKAATPRVSPYKTGWSVGRTFNHTTAYIDTVGKTELKYGRWEIRCRMPVGPQRSVWGGMWLISNKSSEKYFEVDINEGYGRNEKGRVYNGKVSSTHNRAESSVHFDANGKNKVSRFSPEGTDSFETEWHIWAVEIMPDTGITFFLDGKSYFNVPASHPEVATRFAQDFKFNIRINLMTGSYWNTTDSDVERALPLEVDYVRVYRPAK